MGRVCISCEHVCRGTGALNTPTCCHHSEYGGHATLVPGRYMSAWAHGLLEGLGGHVVCIFSKGTV